MNMREGLYLDEPRVRTTSDYLPLLEIIEPISSKQFGFDQEHPVDEGN